MKVAITGPAGFVGMNLVRLLSSHGHQIIAIDQRGFDTGHPPSVTTVHADILDAAAMRRALNGISMG